MLQHDESDGKRYDELGSMDVMGLDMDKQDSVEPVAEPRSQEEEPSDSLDRGSDLGNAMLYPNISTHFPFKTSERLVDDLVHDLAFINSQDHDILYSDLHNGILRAPVLLYSRRISQLHSYQLGTLVDQVTLQTKYEYASKSCPAHNKVNVFMGVLVNIPQDSKISSTAVTELPIYHLKVSVKTRSLLENTRKRAGITHYHLLDEAELHPFDRQDLLTFDVSDPQLVDYAIYVTNDTNKLVLIEIFRPEFSAQEREECWSEDAIKRRYAESCSKYESLDPSDIPTQIDCMNTFYKIFKGPLNRRNSDEPLKTINSDNVVLNSRINPDWLTSKYGFKLHVDNDESTGESYPEFEPPDLTNYAEDEQVRRLRESFVRKCLELIFLGKMAIELYKKDTQTSNSKVFRSFNMIQTAFGKTAWYQVLGEQKSAFSFEPASPLDSNYHFINLLTCFYYVERDIIKNYETQCALDPENTGVYFDALSYVANRKGAYQLVAYCGKQDVVGQEALDQSLRLFGIDPKEVVLSAINDALLLSIYKSEIARNTNENYHADLKNALRLLAKCKSSSKLKFFADYEPYSNKLRGYEILEVDESVDDDIIETAYSIKVNDSPGLKIDCDRSLYTVATDKRSLRLFNFLTQQCPEFEEYYGPTNLSYFEALNLLQLNENAKDETILEVFQRMWNQEPVLESDHFLKLRSALAKIGLERNSRLILHFLSSGTIDASCLPADTWPAGLNNIGNTCYLNSLLQYYFSIAPLRDYVLGYHGTMENYQQNSVNHLRRIGGREVSDSEVERSVQFLHQLRELFHSMIYSTERCVTPKKELAYLAFAPSSFEVEFELPSNSMDNQDSAENRVDEGLIYGPHLPERAPDGLISLDSGGDKDLDLSMSQSLRKEDKDANEDISMTDTEKENIMTTSTRVAKISSDQLENALEMGRQQDVTECIGNVLFQLESASDPISLDEDNEQNDLIKQLFYGDIKQTIIPLANETQTRTKIERFSSLLVNIGDHPKDIYDALDLYFSDERLTMAEYGEVKRTVAATKFPRILQIHIQRVYYDRERFMPFKSIEPLPFNEVLYMDRYSDSKDPNLLKIKKETEAMKSKLATLKRRQRELLSVNDLGLSRKAAFIETINYLKSDALQTPEASCSDEKKSAIIRQLTQATTDIDNELTSLYHQISDLENKISKQFDEFQTIGYSLFAVFIHRGEASYGHYWVYIKDRFKNGIWRKYNDETITEVPESEVLNFTEGNTATPYFLVYIQKGHEQDIEPLKRIVDRT
ncbi:hypothetical protein HG536_0F02720 [Torulaspora globosa]|uniref:Ubiquitin carboxyl-terminal hydrolase 2 n=1 Tax=Torulaspora globosa TaxID=48254 RepID=A0A7G3ZKB1_9SACH|nr:uncharacterized protein HG536_0F02720 [Torulaspora globosa]QLL33947.1 hypothetical protein HG536_0F02720 [Torulaspora globosa]